MPQEPWLEDLVTKGTAFRATYVDLACGHNFQMRDFEAPNSRAYWARGVFGLVG